MQYSIESKRYSQISLLIGLFLYNFTEIIECSSSPCGNGGACTDAVNSYTCSCVAGYGGTYCENG